jgi:hypothetical protein
LPEDQPADAAMRVQRPSGARRRFAQRRCCHDLGMAAQLAGRQIAAVAQELGGRLAEIVQGIEPWAPRGAELEGARGERARGTGQGEGDLRRGGDRGARPAGRAQLVAGQVDGDGRRPEL